jgi:DNA gyrase subunit A
MMLRTRAADLRVIGRATQGVRLIEMEEGDMVVGVAKLAEREEENGEGGPPESTPNDQTPNSQI